MRKTTQGLPMLVIHTLSYEDRLAQMAVLERRERLGLTDIAGVGYKALQAGYTGYNMLKGALSNSKSAEAALLLEAGNENSVPTLQAKLEIKGTVAIKLDTSWARNKVAQYRDKVKHIVERAFQAVLGATSLAEAVGKALKKLLDATGLAALLGESASELTADTIGDGIQDMATELLGAEALTAVLEQINELIDEEKAEKELEWSLEASYDVFGVFKLWPEVNIKTPLSEDDDEEKDEDEKSTELLKSLWGVGGAAVLGTDCGTTGLCKHSDAMLTKTLLSKTMQYCQFEQEVSVKDGEDHPSFAFKVEHLPASHVPDCGMFFVNFLYAMYSGQDLVALGTSIFPSLVVGQAPRVLEWSDVMYANNNPVPKPLTHNPQYACGSGSRCSSDATEAEASAKNAFSCQGRLQAIEKALSFSEGKRDKEWTGKYYKKPRKLFDGEGDARTRADVLATLQSKLTKYARYDPCDKERPNYREGSKHDYHGSCMEKHDNHKNHKNEYPKMKGPEWNLLKNAYWDCLTHQKALKGEFIDAVETGIGFGGLSYYTSDWKVPPMNVLDLTTGFLDGEGGRVSLGRNADADTKPQHFRWLDSLEGYIQSGVQAALEIDGKVKFTFGYGAKISSDLEEEDDEEDEEDEGLERDRSKARRAAPRPANLLERLSPARRAPSARRHGPAGQQPARQQPTRHQPTYHARIVAEVDALERLLEA